MNKSSAKRERILMFCLGSDHEGIKFEEVGGCQKVNIPWPLPDSVGLHLKGRHAVIAFEDNADRQIAEWLPLPDDLKMGGPKT